MFDDPVEIGDYGSMSEESIRWFRHEAEAFAKQNGL